MALVVQAPRVPVLAEDLEMKKLINTYGKTFHTWQVDRGDELPFGKQQEATLFPVGFMCCTVVAFLLYDLPNKASMLLNPYLGQLC